MSKFKALLHAMVQKQASDLFLSAGTPVTFKINGTCVAINSQALPSHAPLSLLSDVISDTDMALLQTSGELNTAIRVEQIGNFRISAMRQRNSYAAVIRALASHVPSIETLQLPLALCDLIMAQRGLIVVVGAAGSGKSTTVASMLEWRNERQAGHILTIEDPIEYVIHSKRSVVNQREIGADTTSFEVALRNGLRQAPDVIFIGEIRDAGTMAQAMAYAQTGHLCIATLHAGNCRQTLTRILNFYPPEVREGLRIDLSQTLSAIVAQRLVRSTEGNRLPVIELLSNTAYISDLIARNELGRIEQGIEDSLTAGCQTFDQDFARLVLAGKITRDVALANADSPNNLMRRLDEASPGGELVY